jgi:hypothetical protein
MGGQKTKGGSTKRPAAKRGKRAGAPDDGVPRTGEKSGEVGGGGGDLGQISAGTTKHGGGRKGGAGKQH